MTSDNNNQTDQLNTKVEQAEQSVLGDNVNADKPSHSHPDAKIHAHRKQHRRQLRKLVGGGLAVAFIIFALFAGKYYMGETSEQPTTDPQLSEPILSDSEVAKFREDFKQALVQYELTLQSDVNEIMLSDFEPNRTSELALLKEQALTAFAQGAFLRAKQTLDQLSQKSKTLVRDWNAQIAQHVKNGQAAFNSDQIPQAQLNVNKALALSSTNIAALELQNRIYAHGEVSKLIDDLKIAVNENNWPKQVEVITDIIELDPERSELEKELESATSKYEHQQLAKYLEEADLALQNGELTKAAQLVSDAKNIKPNSKGAAALEARISAAKAQLGLTGLKTKINAAIQEDNWDEVNAMATSTLAKHPNDADIKKYQSQAQQVLSAKKSLTIFLERPDRLADDGVREAAAKMIQSSFKASLLSPSLQKQIEQVATSIDQYAKPVEITVNSDGNTYIVVLGVGHVGQHKEKVISLTPGDYVLQGKRDGYKNKRLEFTVRANTPLALTLICDERI